MRIFEVPEGKIEGPCDSGLIQIEPDDKVLAYIPVQDLKDEEYANNNFVVLATRELDRKRPSQPTLVPVPTASMPSPSVKATSCSGRLTNGDNEIIIGKSGKAIRFHESTARAVGQPPWA